MPSIEVSMQSYAVCHIVGLVMVLSQLASCASDLGLYNN